MGQLSPNSHLNVGTPMHKLDLIDKRILVLLGQNGRMSYSSLARNLKTGRETIAYHLKKMKNIGFLHGCLTLLNTRQLGFRNYLAYIKFTGLQNGKDPIIYLQEKKEITRIKNCSGLFDLQLTFSVRTPEELVHIIEELTQKFPFNIQAYELMEILDENFLGLSLITMPEKTIPFSPQLTFANPTSTSVDDKDLHILDILKLEGDISLLELSRQVELAPIAVRNRLKKLQSAKIIKCFIPLASLDQIGFQWWKVLIKSKNLNADKFCTYTRMHPNIIWCMRLLGRWDYQISIFARNNTEFHQILDDLRANFTTEIVQYDSLIIFNQLKFIQRIR